MAALNKPLFEFKAGVAQLVERLICNQVVGGSSPFASSKKYIMQGRARACPLKH